MKFTNSEVTKGVNFLYNDHFVTMAGDMSDCSSLATDGVIPAGTIIPANDATAVGVLLNDVTLDENPNGVVVMHGFINSEKLPTAPSDEAIAALKQIIFS